MTEWISSRVPEPPHPYANWIATDDFVIVSGVVGIGPDDSIPEDAGQQAEYAFDMAEHFLAEAGSSLKEAVWVATHLTNIADVEAVNAVAARRLGEPRPAGGAFTVVTALALPVLKVEFDIFASKGGTKIARSA